MIALPLIALLAGVAQPEPTPPPPPPSATAPAAADIVVERLTADLRSIPAKRAALGDAEHREGLVKTEAWLLERLRAAKVEFTTQEFVWNSPALKKLVAPADSADTPDERFFRFRNYIVEFPGTDLAREVLIIGAHYDAVPNSPGADDNASGVAALLEIARGFKGTTHRRSVRLVFFTLEEVGLVGASEYVKSKRAAWEKRPAPKDAPDKTPEGSPEAKPESQAEPLPAEEIVVGMISLECIGYFSDVEGSQISPIPKIGGKPVLSLEIPTKGNFIGLGGIAKHRGFSQRLVTEMRTAVPELPVVAADSLPFAPPDFLRSDHAPFLLAGLPAVILTNTANFRNRNYHTPGDTVDTLDPARLARVTRAVSGAVSVLAERIRKDPHE